MRSPATRRRRRTSRGSPARSSNWAARSWCARRRWSRDWTTRQLTEMFLTARNEDYAKLVEEARDLERRLDAEPSDAEVTSNVARLRRQLSEVAAIDFFSADGRDAAERLIAGLETRLQERSAAMNLEQGLSAIQSPLMNKVWVTREHVQIDRIASAWLVRRFIDPKVRFKFVL